MHTHSDNSGVDAGFDALGYSYANRPASSRDVAAIGERSLWCSVIEQAFVDIGVITDARGTRKSNQPEEETFARARSQDYDAAVRWLLRDKHDFIYVCMLAGVSPSVIRRAAQILVS